MHFVFPEVWSVGEVTVQRTRQGTTPTWWSIWMPPGTPAPTFNIQKLANGEHENWSSHGNEEVYEEHWAREIIAYHKEGWRKTVAGRVLQVSLAETWLKVYRRRLFLVVKCAGGHPCRVFKIQPEDILKFVEHYIRKYILAENSHFRAEYFAPCWVDLALVSAFDNQMIC